MLIAFPSFMSSQTSLKVLVVGSGGREHALVQACRESPLCREVIAAPGNGGMAGDITCFPVAADNLEGLARLASEQEVDLAIIGPEVPLSLGLADRLRENGVLVYGPGKKAARLEGSKVFTKELLEKYGIPTAESATFTRSADALNYLGERARYPVVVKADGLAAGKGVLIAGDREEAEKAVRACLDERKFGDSGGTILIEEHLTGEEASIHLMVSGTSFVVLPTSQDHKRIGDGDTGPNTGGMGAYSPAEVVDPESLEVVRDRIIQPSVDAIAAEGLDLRGTLFIGIMLTESGPRVLEFNVRFGDPETQVILPRMETDPLELMLDCASGKPLTKELQIRPEPALCVVIAAGGYPKSYRKGDLIEFPPKTPTNAFIFHAGTSTDREGRIVTAGGRVLGVTVLAETLAGAAQQAYALCEEIRFADSYYRRDIGAKQLSREP